MKKLLIIFFVLCSLSSYAQYPATQTLGSDSTAIKAKGTFFGRYAPYRYTDTTQANRERISQYPGARISVGNSVYIRDSTTTRWILNGSTGSAINNGLNSIGGITLVDSTVTLQHDIIWSINGSTFTRATDTSFVVHTADSGYYRRDLIYADNEGIIHLLEGTQDTSRAITPPLPSNSIQITTVDVYGEDIATPIPTVIGKIPNLQQVTDAGDTTTNPIILLNNTTQSAYQVFTDANRGNYLYYQNKNSGGWAGSGFLFKNDYPGATPDNEHSGHFLQLYMGSTTNDLVPDGGLIRTNTDNGTGVSNDSGHIYFMQGFPFSAAVWDTMMRIDKGILELPHYKNTEDDVFLTTNEFGKAVLKTITTGITQAQLDDTASAIRNDFPVAEGVSWGDITGSIPDQTDLLDSLNNKVNKTDRFSISVIKPIIALNDSTLGFDSLNLTELRYSLTDRDTTNWTDTTLIDKKFFLDRLASYTPGGGTNTTSTIDTTITATAGQTSFVFASLPTRYIVMWNGIPFSNYTTSDGTTIITGFTDVGAGDKIRLYQTQ